MVRRLPGRTAALLLRLGHRTGLGAGAGTAVHRLGLVVAALAVGLAGGLCVAVDAVYTARAERLATRTPVAAEAGHEEAAFAYWSERGDTVGERRFSVVFVEPTRLDAPPPPGLPRWPRPGEAYVSPALLAADESVATRYGALAGTIGQEGLSEPGEWLVYQRPASAAGFGDDAGGPAAGVVDWGVTPSEWLLAPSEYHDARHFQPPFFLDNTHTDRPTRDLYALLAVVVLLPVAALVLVAVRFGAERRDRRLAMLHALGAPLRARVAVLAGEALLPVAVGASVAAALAWVPTVTGVTLPVAGYEVLAGDLARARPALGVVWLVSIAVVTGAAVVGQLRIRRARGTRPGAVRARAHRWGPYVFALAMAVALGGAIRGGGVGVVTYLAGLLGALATLPLVAGRIAARLGRWTARTGRSRGRPAILVAGRWLAARPHALARLSAALVIGLCLATLAQISFTRLDTALAQERELSNRIGHSVVEVRARWDAASLQEFRARVGVERTIEVARTADGRHVLVGDCDSLAALGELAACPAEPVGMTEVYQELTPAGAVVRSGSLLSDSAMAVMAGQTYRELEDHGDSGDSHGLAERDALAGVLVHNPAGADGVDRVKQAAYATLSMPQVTVPGGLALTGMASWAGLGDWLLEFAVWGFVVLFCTGVLAAAAVFLALARELGPLAGQGSGARLFHAVAWWNLAVPLSVALLASAVVAAGLGRMLILLSSGGTLDLGFLITATAGGIVVAGAVTVLCGHGAARSARAWRPAGE